MCLCFYFTACSYQTKPLTKYLIFILQGYFTCFKVYRWIFFVNIQPGMFSWPSAVLIFTFFCRSARFLLSNITQTLFNFLCIWSLLGCHNKSKYIFIACIYFYFPEIWGMYSMTLMEMSKFSYFRNFVGTFHGKP